MQKLHYIIYKITNLANEKIYIGKHQTRDLDDNYLGSGKLLKRAIDKYGVENFCKEILHVFDNEADMNAKEAELVTEEFVLQESNYNLCVGGQGGWSYVNRLGKSTNTFENDVIQRKASRAGNDKKKQLFESDAGWVDSYKKAMSKSQKRRFETQPGTFTGRTHSSETKKLISQTSKGKCVGKKNSQFGTCWITNGTQNKKISKTDAIPNGWRLGRK